MGGREEHICGLHEVARSLRRAVDVSLVFTFKQEGKSCGLQKTEVAL